MHIITGYTGSDIMLLNLAQAAFERAGWPAAVGAGWYAFEPENRF